jgi:hypothetical protein
VSECVFIFTEYEIDFQQSKVMSIRSKRISKQLATKIISQTKVFISLIVLVAWPANYQW